MGSFADLADKIIDTIKRTAASAMYIEAERVMTESKLHVPVDTGTLRSTGFVEKPTINNNIILVKMGYGGPAAPYAKAVHDGYPPHEIRVKNAKVLAVPRKEWRGRLPGSKGLPKLSKNGEYVILGKRVYHPGFKGIQYLREPVEKNLDKIKQTVGEKIARAVRELKV